MDKRFIRRGVTVENSMSCLKSLTLTGHELNFDDSTAAGFSIDIEGFRDALVRMNNVPDKRYLVKQAPLGEKVVQMSGKDLEAIGFKVKLNKKYDSRLFEIQLIER